MSAGFVDMNRRLADRREANRIAAARPDAVLSLADAKAAHPAFRAKQQQAERQQVLGALVAAVGEREFLLISDLHRPLLTDVLLRNAPQARTEPAVTVFAFADAVALWRSDPDEALMRVSQLAAGTCSEPAYGTLPDGLRCLVDDLAGAR